MNKYTRKKKAKNISYIDMQKLKQKHVIRQKLKNYIIEEED